MKSWMNNDHVPWSRDLCQNDWSGPEMKECRCAGLPLHVSMLYPRQLHQPMRAFVGATPGGHSLPQYPVLTSLLGGYEAQLKDSLLESSRVSVSSKVELYVLISLGVLIKTWLYTNSRMCIDCLTITHAWY